MKRYTLLILTFVLVLGGRTSAQNPAGIVLYFKSGGEIYVLLAEDVRKTRGWAAFGGGAHENETQTETAARETEEETRGYFTQAELLKKIEKQQPVIDDNTFALFFAEVNFVPAQRVTNHEPRQEDRSYFERGPYAWIPFSVIEKYVQDEVTRDQKYPVDREFLPRGSETDWLWPVWLGNIRKAVERNALPWEGELKAVDR